MPSTQLATLLRHLHKLAAGRGPNLWTDRQLLDNFVIRRDESAFAALVARHGPMVLRVCRRMLNHEQDAEDAFQAAFLVLARNSGSIHKPEALANWLHAFTETSKVLPRYGVNVVWPRALDPLGKGLQFLSHPTS